MHVCPLRLSSNIEHDIGDHVAAVLRPLRAFWGTDPPACVSCISLRRISSRISSPHTLRPNTRHLSVPGCRAVSVHRLEVRVSLSPATPDSRCTTETCAGNASPSSQYPNFYPESSAKIEHIFLVYAVALARKCSCCRNRWCDRSRCSEAIEFAGFVHERMYVPFGVFKRTIIHRPSVVKNLMYGFGDDRNPANDTVNVMEEILIEYITDVVRCLAVLSCGLNLISIYSAKPQGHRQSGFGCPSKTFDEHYLGRQMPRSLREWRSCSSCRRTSSVHARNFRRMWFSTPKEI